VPLNALKDFTFLYIYFFSDYYVLDDWRKSTRAIAIADNILSKPIYRNCKNDDQRQAASCLLRHLSDKSQIELYAVRYDEGIRNTNRINVNKTVGR
jgi:hypothetical protein